MWKSHYFESYYKFILSFWISILKWRFWEIKLKWLILARISISCHFKKLFMIENTLKIIIPSLFKAEIQYNLLIMKFKLMQNLLANFAINSNEPWNYATSKLIEKGLSQSIRMYSGCQWRHLNQKLVTTSSPMQYIRDHWCITMRCNA